MKRTVSPTAPQSLLPVSSVLLEHHLGDFSNQRNSPEKGSSKPLKTRLLDWKKRTQVPQVLLLLGPRGSGKRELSHWLCQWMLCSENGLVQNLQRTENLDLFASELSSADPVAQAPRSFPPPPNEPQDLLPCGKCQACARATHGTWSQVQEIKAEETESSAGSIKIEQLRELKAKAGYSAEEGSFLFFLIPDAEFMTPQAANSILKLLEEPPRGWIFILTASDSKRLLPTLLSRCQRIQLEPFSSEKVTQILIEKNIPALQAQGVAELAQGNLHQAQLLLQPEVWEQRKIAAEFLAQPHQEFNRSLEWATQNPAFFELFLTLLESHLHWILTQFSSKANPSRLIATPELSLLLQTQIDRTLKDFEDPQMALQFWLARFDHLQDCRLRARSSANRKILLQSLLASWINPRATHIDF